MLFDGTKNMPNKGVTSVFKILLSTNFNTDKPTSCCHTTINVQVISPNVIVYKCTHTNTSFNIFREGDPLPLYSRAPPPHPLPKIIKYVYNIKLNLP